MIHQRIHLIKNILDMRLQGSLADYLERCINVVSGITRTRILDGMGELLDPELKTWVKTELVADFVSLARMYKEMPHAAGNAAGWLRRKWTRDVDAY